MNRGSAPKALAVRPCKALNSLSLHFLICKMGFIITVMTTEATQ